MKAGMDEEVIRQFVSDQAEEMKRYKWIASEAAGKDLGQDAVMEWVKKYAPLYRAWWIENHQRMED